MLDRIIRTSLNQRHVVLLVAALMLMWGGWTASRMPVDVLPDLTAPTVTVGTEAHGMAPQEVERLITQPVESAMQGAAGVRRVRSTSHVGLSLVHVEFDWDVPILQARQVVSERLQAAVGGLPPGTPTPVLLPISSVMGEIMFVALESDQHSPMDIRAQADWEVRRRLLAVPGVSQVVPIGGEVRQYQVLLKQDRLLAYRLTAEEVAEAVKKSGESSSAGFLVHQGQEYLIHGIGRLQDVSDLESALIIRRDGQPVKVKDLAEVKIGPALKRGEGSHNGRPAVLLAIQKQPAANTLELTKRLDQVMDEIQTTLPQGMKLEKHIFRQANFIQVAIRNVVDALRDGTLLVILVVGLFLMHTRATLITAVAVPLSLVAAVLALKAFGATLNTMTLGGMALAIGDLVDDAIIDVENVLRRLRENASKAHEHRKPFLQVVYKASMEIRSSIVYATAIIMVVFTPIFFLGGVEGRMLQPLGIAFTVALGASLLVALTVTPALCAWLLPHDLEGKHAHEGRFVTWIKDHYTPILTWAMPKWRLLIALGAVGLLAATLSLFFAGRSFMPEFNEGSLNVTVVCLPGTPLSVSDALGRQAEEIMLKHPEVVATARRTGRAELDEHGQDVFGAEIEVGLKMKDRSKEELLAALRKSLSQIPGVFISLGQPISHRVDHILSGSRAAIAVKVFGPDRLELRRIAQEVKSEMGQVRGVVDLAMEAEAAQPQLAIKPDRAALASAGLTTQDFAHALELSFAGEAVAQVREGNRAFDVLVKMEPTANLDAERIGSVLVSTPTGPVPISQLAKVDYERAPAYIPREDNQRKLAVTCNVGGRDLFGVVSDIQARIKEKVKLPQGYQVTYGGQFESGEGAARTLTLLGFGAVIIVFGLLFLALRSFRDATLVMVNLPLAWMGGVLGLWASGGVLSVATLIGFITLFGIATRNGIMLVTHIHHLHDEGLHGVEAIRQAALERLSPILMTALTAGLALVPIILRRHAPGSEIQAPMAFVILFGLLSSTALNMLVVPSLYLRFGSKAGHRKEEGLHHVADPSHGEVGHTV
ncbi:MAG: efflux RND transporter permease subunit [Acidobacteria bacterium]|nr:efflux RND transporter permease subunit [Acidobacteriota bacterium]MBI3487167.1 efflux RND transporter permease subunit [Acidobacteriota bacterium]